MYLHKESSNGLIYVLTEFSPGSYNVASVTFKSADNAISYILSKKYNFLGYM